MKPVSLFNHIHQWLSSLSTQFSFLSGFALAWVAKDQVLNNLTGYLPKFLALRLPTLGGKVFLLILFLGIFTFLIQLLIHFFRKLFPVFFSCLFSISSREPSILKTAISYFCGFSTILIAIFFLKNNGNTVKELFLLNPIVLPILLLWLVILIIFPISNFIIQLNPNSTSKVSFTLSKLRKVSPVLILLASFVFVFLLFGSLLKAKFGVIDDHEIIRFLGPDKKLGINEIFLELKQTEVGNFGSLERFRPVYYFLRLLECVIWGAHPELWYLARIILLTISIATTWHLLAQFSGFFTSSAITAYLLTLPLWVGIFGRLGPSEAYIAVGLPIYIWGFLALLHEKLPKRKSWLASIAIIFGTIVCVGSKENLVILIIPSTYLFFTGLRKRNFLSILSSVISDLACAFVGIAVFTLINKNGTDVYGMIVSPIQRFLALFLTYKSIFANPLFYIGLLFLLYLLLLAAFRNYKTISTNVLHSLIALLIIASFVFSQMFFYQGSWPLNSRYDYPGILYLPAIVIILQKTITTIISEKIPNLPTSSVAICVSLGLLLLTFSRGYQSILSTNISTVETTNNFANKVNSIIESAKSHPEDIIVLESSNVWDYEPIFSYQIYLVNSSVQNPITLRIHNYSPDSVEKGLEVELAQELSKLSQIGDNRFQSISTLEKYGSDCISVMISAETETNCSIEK